MTITARQTSTRVRATMMLVDKLTALPIAVAAIHTAIDDGLERDDDRQRAEDAGIRSKGGHSDPTGEAAIARVAKHERHLADIEDNLATLALAAGNLCDIISRWVASVNVAPAIRCSGGRTIDEWSRPDCTNWVPETSKGSGVLRGDGLCDACRMAKSRFERAAEVVA
jgi:hypothetical protein